MATPLGILRIKLELRVKQTWHLIGRSVDAHLLIVHWGFLAAGLDVVFIWDFDMLDYWWLNLIALLSVLILILAWLFWSLHMHTLTTVYHSAWHVDSLTCILFWPSLSMMIVSLSIWLLYSRLSCVYIDDISELCLIACSWLPSSCVIACCLSMWVAHLSPYLQLSWFRSFLSFWFSLLQVWDLPCACSLTEPEIRSRI